MTENERFNSDVSRLFRNVDVTDKFALLAEPDFGSTLAQLQNETLEGQEIVDYLVLLRSSYFVGTCVSSFSFSLSRRRHGVGSKAKWIHTSSLEEICPPDESSALYCKKDQILSLQIFESGLYP